MSKLTDTAIIKSYFGALSNYKYEGYVIYTETAWHWVRNEMPGWTQRRFSQMLFQDALRERLHLLTPGQIRAARKALGLRQYELARRLRIAPATISRWETGSLIQSGAMDNYLRIYFAMPEVRNALTGEAQDPSLGTHAFSP